MNRRAFLRAVGASAGTTSAIGLGGCTERVLSRWSARPGSSDQQRENTPGPGTGTDRVTPVHPRPGGWRLAFEDTFEASSLDSSSWGIGWGWGRKTSTSPTTIVPSNVTVAEGQLQLSGSHEGNSIQGGGVHTRNNVEFGPGSYIEARLKFAGRNGFLNAFWSKPSSGRWPPEIDVVELWQNRGRWVNTHVSRHNLHYTASTKPGDSDTHRTIGTKHVPGGDLTRTFHVYGLEWREDHISHFVDGIEIWRWTDREMLTTMETGAPFYFMFSLNINKVGEADTSAQWDERFHIDWVRLWKR